MAEHVMGPSQTLWQINSSGVAPVYLSGISSIIGSIAITNAHIDVDVTVDDYVSVTQSGNYIVTLGSTNINNVITGSVVQSTNPWIVLGSVAVTNNQTGSVIQTTNPWIVLGSVAVSNNQTGSVIQSTNPWITLGSVAITNVTTGSVVQKTSPWIVLGSVAVSNNQTGSVIQSTNPWITLGSTQITNPPYLGSTYYVSGTQDSKIMGFTTHEQLVFLAGSPSNQVNPFLSGAVETVAIKCSNDTYVNFDATATINSFLVDAGQSINANFKAGSVNTLAKTSAGSVWVWGGR